MKARLTIILLFAGVPSPAAAGPPPSPPWDGKESVAEYARCARLAPTLALDLGGGVKWEGVLIPAGGFVMGSPKGEARTEQEAALERPHRVTITPGVLPRASTRPPRPSTRR